MKKKLIAYGLLLVSCLCLLVVGIVTVLATTQRKVDAGLFVRFTAEDVDGSVTMYYRIGGSGDWVKNGDTIVFNAEDNDNQAKTTDLTLDSEVTKSSKYVEFKYEFVNTGSKYYTATMMLETTERENISLTYKYNDPEETKEYENSKYAVVVPGETDASNAKTYFIKVGMEDLSRSANFSGTFNWILKGYNLVNNEELVLTNLDYVETSVAGTYSAKYNGSPLEDNTLIIPSKLGDSPVTTVGKCEGTLPENTKVVVSEGVTSIGEYAFKNQKGLIEVEMPASLTIIDVSSFQSCSNLASIKFPENSALIEIRSLAFVETNINNIELPDSVENIDNMAFYASGLTSFTIPASVINIGSGAFSGTNLKTLIVEEGNTNFKMDGNCLIEISSGRLIKGLDDCVIPDDGTIKNIDNYSLMTLNINPKTLPEGITRIGPYAFHSCTNIIELTLPSTLIELGAHSLSCNNLASITIPKGVEKIEEATFIPYIKNIILEDGNLNYKIEGNCLIDIKLGIIIKGFDNSVIPTDGSIKRIGGNSFAYTNIESLIIPEGVTVIGYGAFNNCENLKSITMGMDINYIGTRAFVGCSSLTSVMFGNTSGWMIPQTSTSLYSTDLADPSIAVTYLTSTYLSYYWQRF